MPQRYQLVNSATPIQAGLRLLSYSATLPFGIVLASALTGKFHIPFLYPLIFGASLQIVGFGLLSTLPTAKETWPGQYGYNVIAGLGIGISIGAFFAMGPVAVDKKDQRKFEKNKKFYGVTGLKLTIYFRSCSWCWYAVSPARECLRYCRRQQRTQQLYT
jgi:hypothetical protein